MKKKHVTLKVIIACEESQAVCKAFRALGHEAYSCDLQECSGGHPEWHLQMDALEAIKLKKWDLMIAHPPCTYLSYAGMGYWNDPIRTMLRIGSAKFFMQLYNSDIPHIAIENPQGIMMKLFRNPDQEIHPYYFGDPELKRTHLWLRNLPPLNYEKDDNLFAAKTAVELPPPEWRERKSGKKNGGRYRLSFCIKNRSPKVRSKTFNGIAKAMAEQWSAYILSKNGNE